jgi:hypothetical protein
VDDPKLTAGMSSERLAQFEADIAKVRVRTGASSAEPRLVTLGIALMAAGVGLALAAFVSSGSMSDTRDVLSAVILAVAGLGVVVAGAAVFLRYSLGRFLRFWLLRLIYEQQSPADPD